MRSEMELVTNDLRTRNDDQSLPLEAFDTQARQYLKDIASVQSSLYDIYNLFRSGKDIWPHQCESAITLVYTITQPIHEFSQLLEITAQLPAAVIPLRYPLAVALHHVDEQTRELVMLLAKFSTACQTLSKYRVRQLQEIQQLFKSLIVSLNDIVEKIPILLDQARFQSRKLGRIVQNII